MIWRLVWHWPSVGEICVDKGEFLGRRQQEEEGSGGGGLRRVEAYNSNGIFWEDDASQLQTGLWQGGTTLTMSDSGKLGAELGDNEEVGRFVARKSLNLGEKAAVERGGCVFVIF